MFERYTEQARRTLFFARYEAFQLGSAFIETEHLLLALFREEDSVTARVLARAQLSLNDIRQEVEARTARRALVSESSELPFSEDTKSALQYAAQEADRLLHNHVGTEHLLLGLLREEHGVAAAILRENRLRLAPVRDQIVQMPSASSVPLVDFPLARLMPPGDVRLLHVTPSRRDPHEEPVVVSSLHRVNADGFTLRELIAWAYRADTRSVDMPADLDNRERYDAGLDLPGPQSWPAIDRLIQDGINKHFAIAVTRETRPSDVFVLTSVDGPSPGRRRSDDDAGFGGSATMYAGFSTVAFSEVPEPLSHDGPDWRDRLHSVGPISLTGTTIEDFGHWLEDFVGHPVIDETGLTGAYDIEVHGEMQGLDELRRALAEQLALALARTQREMPRLVVRRST